MTSYPDDNPKTIHGLKKPSMAVVPTTAMIHLMGAMQLGADKYGPFNWRDKTVSSSIYYAAAMRHLMSWFDGEDMDPESGFSHLGHVMACCAIIIDGFDCGKVNDDRPPEGNFADLVREFSKKDMQECSTSVRS